MPRLNLYEQQTTAQGPRASGADFGAAPAQALEGAGNELQVIGNRIQERENLSDRQRLREAFEEAAGYGWQVEGHPTLDWATLKSRRAQEISRLNGIYRGLLDKAGPVAASSAKALVRRVALGRDRDATDRDNAALIARLRVSAEGQEGLGAFLDKRAPHWVTQD